MWIVAGGDREFAAARIAGQLADVFALTEPALLLTEPAGALAAADRRLRAV